MRHVAHRLWTDESGQDLVEYALLLVLLALVTLAAVRLLGTTISDFFGTISNNLNNVM
jgi:pilus assembly protein Flp/PilA